MIQVIYTGTIDEDFLMQKDKAELMESIGEMIKHAIESSVFSFSEFSCSSSPNLPEGKVIFQAFINIIPREHINDDVEFPELNEN